MAIPEPIAPQGLADYLAVMSRAVFQAGLSWKMIETRWPHYLRLFENFDPLLVAAFDATDLDRILGDGGVVRTYKKMAATVANARTMLELDAKHHGFAAYLHSFDCYEALAADLRKRFAFLGDLSVYYFLFRVGEPVPRFEDWEQGIPGDHPRMREMVARARERGTSPER
jgi:3-methyladenine DNA glycosylase Tag